MARVKKSPTGRARTATRPYCYDCRKSVRSLIEHRTTATHRAATTSVRSSGPKGSHAYRPPAVMPRPESDYDAWLEEKALALLPPSIDDVFPHEIGEPPAPAAPAERGHRPPPCQRCGKILKTDAGARWHAVNNPHCEKYARKSRAA